MENHWKWFGCCEHTEIAQNGQGLEFQNFLNWHVLS